VSQIKKVGIIRGGLGEDYSESLFLAGQVISHIHEKLNTKWQAVDILIDKEGQWHLKGKPIQLMSLMEQVDLLWNFTHPSNLTFFKNFSFPYLSHSVFHKTILNNKINLNQFLKEEKIDFPRHFILPVYQSDFDGPKEKYIYQKAKDILNKFSAPWIIKSLTKNENSKNYLAKTFPELIKFLTLMINNQSGILIEEFIKGKNISIHFLPGFRNNPNYFFPLLNISQIEKEKIFQVALKILKYFEIKDYLKIDFILTKKKIYLINVDLMPDFSVNSCFIQQIKNVGAQEHQIIEYLLEKEINI